MKTTMQVNATLQRKVTAITFLLSMLWLIGCPFSQTYAQQVYATSQTNGRSGLCLLCSWDPVTNPENAVNNTSLTDYATFNMNGVAVGVSVYENLKFPTTNPNPGCDSLVIKIGTSQSLLSANLISNITITTYNGSTSNDDATTITPDLLRLLSDSTSAVVVLRPTATFDRVEIRESAFIAALSSLRLYYAYYAPVNLNNISIDNGASTTVCSGQPVTLSASVPADGATIQWFTDPSGGAPVAATNNYTFTPTATTTLYAGAVLGNCTSTTRKAITVNVNATPSTPTVAANSDTICSGQTATFSISSPQAGVTYTWYDANAGGTAVGTGTVFITPTLSATTTYYAEASLATGCISPARTPVTSKVNALPAAPVVTPATQAIAGGSTATVSISNPVAGATYNWYTSPSGGTPVGTGTSFTSPALYTNENYYAEITSAAGCVNSSRTLATVTVTINNNVSCSFATTQQSPVYTGGVCALCSVSNPGNAIDTDTTTASSIHIPLSLAGYTGQLLTYPQSYAVGDSVRLLLSLPGGLADLQVLGSVRVETYNNGVANGDAVFLNNPLLTLNILGGERFNATVAATKPFNAVLVSIGGLSTVLTTLNIYGASVIVPRPVITPASENICSGSTASFAVTSPTTDIAWFAAPVGGTALGTGTTFTTPALTANTTYYVESSRYNCANPVRTPVTVQVNAKPASPVLATATDSICEGQTTTLAVTPVTGVTFNWYASDTASTPLATGTNFTTPALSATTTYYVSATNGGCTSDTRTAAKVTVATAPSGITVTPAGASIQAGQAVSFTASASSGTVNFNWFTAATGGASIASGATFTTPLLFANTTYYVEASNATSGCVSTSRVAVAIAVSNPDVPDISCGAAVSQTNATSGLCVGCYVENPALSVDNSSTTVSTLHVILGLLGGYVQQTLQFSGVSQGDSVHIGLSFPTGLADVGLLSGIQVQSYNGATANNDATTLSPQLLTLRLLNGSQATVNFLPAGPYDRIVVRLNSGAVGALTAVNIAYAQRFVSTPTPQEDSVYACGGQPVTLHATTPANATFRWYSQPTGGVPLFTGVDFVTPAVTANTVYYLEAVSADGCTSPARAAVSVFTGLPAAVITPSSVTLNSGETTTFSIVDPNPAYIYTWYDVSSGGTALHTGTTFTTPALTASTSYYVVVSNGSGCTSTARTQATVNINIPVDPAPCSYATTQTSPVNIGGICALCSVSDSLLAVDSDRNTASKITAAVGLLGYYGQTLHFANTYPAGDSVSIELEIPGGIADVQVLGGVRIETYNGATANGDNRLLTDSLIRISLLSTGNRFRVTVPVNKAFNGVNISIGGAVSAITSVLVYDAAAVTPSPVVTPVSGICSGSTATLTATAPANATITWYTQAVDGTAAGTGYAFTTPALTTTTTYYVAAGRYGCNSPARTAVTVNVGNLAAAPTVADVQICAGTTATLTASAPANVNFQWFANATDTTVIFTGNSFSTGVLNADTTFYVASNSNGCLSNRVPVKVSVSRVPASFTVTPSSATVAYGSSVAFTASAADTAAIFNFYSQASGGTPLFTGKTFTTPSLTDNTTYYAEATTAAGCVTNFRIPLAVTVLPDTSNGIVPCDAATSQTNTANGICVGCYIDSPGFSVDSSAATGSTLHTILGLLGGYVSQTLIFPSVSEPGDSVYVDLTVASGLLDVGLLSNLQVGTYNGTTSNNDLQAVNGGLITLRLLSNTQASFVFKPSASFDRIEIRLNSGLAQALNAITIRDAYRKVAAPVVNGNDTTVICAGQQASLSVVPVSTNTVRWYTQRLGGTPIFTGNNYVTPALTNNTIYWLEAVKTSTGCAADVRVPMTVIVSPVPDIPQVLTDTVTICNGSTATFKANAATSVAYKWYASLTGGTPLDSGTTFTTPALTASKVYYLEASSAGGCANVSRKAVLANVVATPPVPVVTPDADTLCAHSNTTLLATSNTPGVIFNWYSSATGGSPISTGPNFTTPLLDTTTTYYVETVAGTCASSTRVAVKVVINPIPTAPVITPASAVVNVGVSETFSADSSRTGITNRWYTVATGGSPVFIGNKYITPPLTANTTYYVESVASTGCVSARTAVNVTVNNVTPACDMAIAETTTVNGLCVGCSVSDPGNAVDADTTSYSTLNLTVGVANAYVSQILTLPQGGAAGDTARFTLEIPGELVSAGLIAGLQVATYNGATSNNDLHNVNLQTITLNLLSSDNKFYLNVVPNNSFDRVEIRLNAGFLSAAQNLRVYYGGLKPVTPGVDITNLTICSGSTAALHATAPATVRLEWYDAPVGGTLLHTGGDFTTPALTAATTFYVQTVRIPSECANPNRVPVTVSVLPVPAVTIDGGDLSICAGQPVSISATVNPATATVRWYNAATGGTLLYTGNPLVTTNLSKDTTFYVEGYNGTCGSTVRTAVHVTVGSVINAPVLKSNNLSICSGQSATLQVSGDTAGLTLRWYTTAIGGTPVFTGSTYNTGALTANAIYYVEAVSTNGTCNNPSARTVANVQVSAQPSVPVPSVTVDTVCVGQGVTLAVSNPQTGITYQWYNSATAGTLLFTGPEFNIAAVDSAAVYYVQAGNGTGCTSATRASVTVRLRTAPAAPTLQVASVNVCTGQTATFTITNPADGVTYRWFDAATGGNQLGTGTSFTTPALTSAATYYVAAYNDNCTSAARTAATVTVGTPVVPTLVSNNVTICRGQQASFTIASPIKGQVYNWYTTATGGTPVFTGTTFTTDNLSATAIFYVDAGSATGDCGGTSGRVTVTATVMSSPDIPTLAAADVQTCGSGSITFNITNPQPGITYQWFNAATDGTLLTSGNSYTVNNITTTTSYYVQALNANSCTSVSRAKATATVSETPTTPVLGTDNLVTCLGSTVTFTVQNPDASLVYTWFDAASGGTQVGSGSSFTSTALTMNKTYFVEAAYPNGGCTSVARAAAHAVVVNNLAIPTVANPASVSCGGQSVTLSVQNPQGGILYRWYTTSTGGTAVFTGPDYTITGITSASTYYVEAATTAGCVSTGRATATITVSTPPATPTVTNDQVGVCTGQQATLTISNPPAGIQYNWYTTASGGTAIATGATFKTPVITGTTNYYVEAENVSGGCTSNTRGIVTVSLLPASVTPTITGDQIICPGTATTLTASSTTAGVVFAWYTSATSTTPVFTGNSFTTPALTTSTTYYVQTAPGSYCGTAEKISTDVNVEQQLDAPVVSVCDSSQATQVTFCWTAVQGAQGYEVSTDGTNFVVPSSGATGTTHTVTGLQPNQRVAFEVRAIGQLGCATSGIAAISGHSAAPKGNVIYVPNVFSPNGDGANDKLMVYGQSIASLHLIIYNQYGQVIFESKDQSNGWDGTHSGQKQPAGVYVYALQATLTDGSQATRYGTITLIR
ncbi:gliding motility-associated C-terminal domain-containing protein [Chitinophaga costaii]|uniref:Gliding motility-associated C-terminal domain-containing protein n=1 Tax=Chitinophaga costaii TaxID=1335309 RepID=A0A1C4AYC4_9BACT|nr:gliding motility-associated C-terminal domain-containing protein [Chitinophaga costaii]PUZ26800.1 hypothetical protein DCM91_10405 [Chitinophaga costaii]SCB99574.1 gliding motility-associated C-terminal domain-containing protein [Chitinophaga costaii]